MACGLPVMVNQDHGAEELFRSRESCLAFPSGFRSRLAQVDQNEILTRRQFTTAVEQVERYLEDTVAQWRSA